VPGQSVLVVEDTDEIRELVVTVLRRAGMDVREASTGAACLEEVRREAPDVVVLDLGLPDADGTEVCRQLRAETDCYVLMLTARAEEVDLLIGLAVGADGYMSKPFSPGNWWPGCRRCCAGPGPPPSQSPGRGPRTPSVGWPSSRSTRTAARSGWTARPST
jgi:CheY-like chemotaxis protein